LNYIFANFLIEEEFSVYNCCAILWLQEAQVTLSLTNPVEHLLKVTLLKVEQDQKDGSKESDAQDKEIKPDENADKCDEKSEKEEQRKNEDEKGKDGKNDEQKTKEKSDAEQEKAAEKDSKKDGHIGVAASKKPGRSIDNSCESRSFVPTAEVIYSLYTHVQRSLYRELFA